LSIDKPHTATKMIIELLQDSLHLDEKEKDKLELISKKIEHKELDESEKEFLTELRSEIRHSDTRDVRKLSDKSRDFTNKLLDRTILSFGVVLTLYVIAFAIGIILIIFSISLASNSTTPNEYLASFFGAAGVLDISFLLHKPAKEIQRSRANATQLWMAFSEWRYVSIWSGKTYYELFKILQTTNDHTTLLGLMIKILKLKSETTVNLIESIEKNVAARPVKKDTKKDGKNGEENGTTNGSDGESKKIKTNEQKKKKKGKQNGDGKKEDQNDGRPNVEHGGDHHAI